MFTNFTCYYCLCGHLKSLYTNLKNFYRAGIKTWTLLLLFSVTRASTRTLMYIHFTVCFGFCCGFSTIESVTNPEVFVGINKLRGHLLILHKGFMDVVCFSLLGVGFSELVSKETDS